MTQRPEPRTGHPYHMYEMIQGQPDAIERVLNEEVDAVRALADRIESAERVHIVGIGTSWHGPLVAEFLLRNVAGRDDARAWNSFEFCSYPPELGPQDLVIIMSHSGTRVYSSRALEMAKARGAQTANVTGLESDAKSSLSDVVIRTSIRDRSSAHTICHTTAMTVLAMVATELGLRAEKEQAISLQKGLEGLPGFVEAALAQEPAIQNWAQQAQDVKRFYFVGWGPNTSTAYEVALKIKEAAYLTTEGFQLEQYLHGPYVATAPGTMVTYIAPPGPSRDRLINIIEATRTVGARTVALVEREDPEISRLVHTAISLPALPEALTPIVYVVALQLFTYWLAVRAGRSPDTFRFDDPVYMAARERYIQF
ncbi:MAG: SIS domain-containing protein [Chloroflexi bacterium]|nr:SIS domain-containing protein [Chloroflexota bacterium]